MNSYHQDIRILRTVKSYSLSHAHLLEELRAKLEHAGVKLQTTSEAIDPAHATLWIHHPKAITDSKIVAEIPVLARSEGAEQYYRTKRSAKFPIHIYPSALPGTEIGLALIAALEAAAKKGKK